MAAANGEKGFVVPELEIKYTKLFINGQFVDAVSGTYLFPSTS
jgi:coniferyl-aldehyde dehydrogenase